MKNGIYITCLILLLPSHLLAQRKVVTQTASFSTATQNMWGPGTAPGINTTFEIFPEYKQKLPFDTRDVTILEFQGLEFGAGIDGFVEFGVGPFQFIIEGFTLGEVDVNYPTDVSIDLPADSSFNSGESIVIKSSFQANPGAEIITRYPSAADARVALELGLLFDADLGLTGCIIDCLPRLSIVPAHTDPILDQDFKFFEVTQSELTYICEDATSTPLPFQCTLSSGGPPWAFTDSKGIFTAEAELPFVVTSSQIIGGKNLEATGEHGYVNNSLNVIKLIGLIPVVAPFAEAIEGSKDLVTVRDVVGNEVSVTVTWALVRITLNIPITHKQEFDFKPEIITKLTFPDTVEYVVHSKTTGDQPGRAPFLEYQIGDSVSVNFPCEYDFMDVFATHRIKNTFSNKTNDNIGLNLKFEALEFGLHIDPFIIIPEVCIPIPFADDLCVGPVGTPEVSKTIGPLVDPAPIVLLDQDFPAYIDNSWELAGFDEFAIAQPFRLTPRKTSVDFVATDIGCFGEATGTITTNFLNATEPVSYEWSFGSTAKSPSNVPAGTHQVKITDARGCVRFESVLINQPEIIEAEISATSINCEGANEADITLAVKGGSGNYMFLWNTGQTTQSLVHQQAGTYTVTISDDNGCSLQESITIDHPSQLVVEIFNPLEPSCNGALDGALDLYVTGGTLPYSYLWSNGQIAQSIDELPVGSYSVSVTDANGCILSDNIVLDQPQVLQASLSISSTILCFSDENGALRVDAQGGTPPYQYTWLNEDVKLGNSGSAANGLMSGNYFVEVVDSKGCRAVVEEFLPQPIKPIQASILATHLTCTENNDGAIDLVVEGGTPPYTYAWTNGAQSEDLSALAEGVYEVLVTDDNGCSAGTKTLVISPKELNPRFAVKDVSCQDQQDAEISIVSITGGFEPYTVEWSTGSQEMNIEGLSEGMYNVVITDNADCQYEQSFEIIKNEVICLFIPTSFSPNSDDINDTWIIRNIVLYPNVELRVFNKWGIDVFKNKGYEEPWDGKFNGRLLEPATYYYIIDLNDGSPKYTGSLSILR